MTETKQGITSIEQAIDIVNKKWVFNAKEYPKLGILTEKQRLVFKLKDTFSRVLECEDLHYLQDDFKRKLSMALFSLEGEDQFFKLFITFAKFVELLDIKDSEVSAGTSQDIQKEYNLCVEEMASVLERLNVDKDHLYEEDKKFLKESVIKFMSHLLSFTKVEIPWEYLNKNLRKFLGN